MMTLLIALILGTGSLLTGCEQPAMKIVKEPIMEVVAPSEHPLEEARAAMERVNERRTAAHQKAEAAGDFSTVFIASEEIFKEELGFRKELWVDLVDIYRQENLDEPVLLENLEKLQVAFIEKLEDGTLGMFYFEYISSFDALIIEYLRLSYAFPEKGEEELLELFRASMRDGKATIIFPQNF